MWTDPPVQCVLVRYLYCATYVQLTQLPTLFTFLGDRFSRWEWSRRHAGRSLDRFSSNRLSNLLRILAASSNPAAPGILRLFAFVHSIGFAGLKCEVKEGNERTDVLIVGVRR